MAYLGISGSYDAPRSDAGFFGRLFAGWFAARAGRPKVGADATPRKLAGPAPRDAKGYLADLDMEVGF